MTMRRLILTIGLGAGLSLPALAQWPAPVERALSREYNACMNREAAGTTSGMMSCSGAEIDRQDARLNQAYRMTMQRLKPVRQARLRADERAWIARRERTCRAEARTYEDGTAGALNFSQCTLRETIARRLWLERYR